MGRCRVPDCNGVTEYDDGAQAELCTTCGTVATQEILTEWGSQPADSSFYLGPRTLKSLRRIGGVLAGQSSKEDKDRRNSAAMHQYISGILNKLVCPGLAPRAHSLFDQARVCGSYRWGRRAVLVAGACVAIVLREGKKAITMSHLASLMDTSPHSLCRMFTQVTTLLRLPIPAFDPITLLPDLQSHLSDLITLPNCSLPQNILTMLRPLPPVLIVRLATSLAVLVTNLGEMDGTTPAMACALLILSLEGQAMTAIPSYGLLAQEIGKKVGTSKELVVAQYRRISKIIEEWMEDIPWVSGANHPDNKLSRKRRRTSQRDVIAMALKDMVQFQEDILDARKKREAVSPVVLDAAGEEDCDHAIDNSQSVNPSIGEKRKRTDSIHPIPSKFPRSMQSRRGKALSRLDVASLSLLSPFHPLASETNVGGRMMPDAGLDDMQTQILTSAAFPDGAPSTRLQKLSAMRGGEGKIEDNELFEEGELEGLLRTGNEVAKLRDILGWEETNTDVQLQTLPISWHQPEWDPEDMAVWTEFDYNNDCDTLGVQEED